VLRLRLFIPSCPLAELDPTSCCTRLGVLRLWLCLPPCGVGPTGSCTRFGVVELRRFILSCPLPELDPASCCTRFGVLQLWLFFPSCVLPFGRFGHADVFSRARLAAAWRGPPIGGLRLRLSGLRDGGTAAGLHPPEGRRSAGALRGRSEEDERDEEEEETSEGTPSDSDPKRAYPAESSLS
jgi:hypothetical protein